ncbi:hypothetical protein DENSPDRAFT_505648 [Dentipellis sp. KUC8613]|nr:hypothetical protein DENSPDRAFT_505648 [Dentipellis sp. KUC8613]
MGLTKAQKASKARAAHARAARVHGRRASTIDNDTDIDNDATVDNNINVINTDDITIETEDTPLEVCGWNGRVDWEYEGVEEDWMDADSNAADEDCTEMVEFEMSELEGDELIENLRRGMLSEEQEFTRPDAEVENNEPTLYKSLVAQKVTPSQWSTAERKRALGYNGLSGRTKRREKKNAKDKAEQDARMRETYVCLCPYRTVFAHLTM